MSVEQLESIPNQDDEASDAHYRLDVERLIKLIHRLKSLDREVVMLYLEDLDAATIGEITGASAANVRTKIHRIKAMLARRFQVKGQG
jgi:RNA polymerase sigma-70 factor (ECF subfamily)